MKSYVLAFSGQIASGKTTISIAVSEAFSWKYASFGNFVRAKAAKRGICQPTREQLQKIGNELIDSGWEDFCWAVVRESSWESGEGLVVDGIRHIECLHTLCKILYPTKVFSIYVGIDAEIRDMRLSNRGISRESLLSIESHPTEIQVQSLVSSADFILDGSNDIPVLIRDIQIWLSCEN